MLTSLLITASLAPLLQSHAPVPTVDAAVELAWSSPALDEFKDLFKEAGKDVEKLWKLYEWTLEDDGRRKYRKRVLTRLIKTDPEHVGAHEALGHVEYEGKWYDSEKALDKALAAMAKEKGLVKYDGKWVPQADAEMMARGLVKDELGKWYDPVERKRLAEGWKRQDLVWIEPAEVSKIDEGLWKCGDKWLPLDQANEWHNDLETPWVIPTERAIVWSTAERKTVEKAGKQAAQAYYDMRKVFGFGGDLPIPFMVSRSQSEYLRFMDGSEDYELPQLDPLAMSSMNRAAFADLWFDFDEEMYRGMGVTYWDESDPNADAFGTHDARFAYGLSFVESIDPAIEAAEEVLKEGEVEPRFAEDRIRAHKLPRWFRWGAAAYASRWFVDNQVKRGGDPFWARKWSATNLSAQGGLMSMDEFFDFEAHGGNERTARLLLQAGATVAYLVDGKNPALDTLLADLQKSLEKREDTAKIFDAIRKELSSKEEQIRAFAGL